MRDLLNRWLDPGTAPGWVPFLILALAVGAFALVGGCFPVEPS